MKHSRFAIAGCVLCGFTHFRCSYTYHQSVELVSTLALLAIRKHNYIIIICWSIFRVGMFSERRKRYRWPSNHYRHHPSSEIQPVAQLKWMHDFPVLHTLTMIISLTAFAQKQCYRPYRPNQKSKKWTTYLMKCKLAIIATDGIYHRRVRMAKKMQPSR